MHVAHFAGGCRAGPWDGFLCARVVVFDTLMLYRLGGVCFLEHICGVFLMWEMVMILGWVVVEMALSYYTLVEWSNAQRINMKLSNVEDRIYF